VRDILWSLTFTFAKINMPVMTAVNFTLAQIFNAFISQYLFGKMALFFPYVDHHCDTGSIEGLSNHLSRNQSHIGMTLGV